MRSIVGPQRIATPTAANVNWKRNFVSREAPDAASAGNVASVPCSRNPVLPNSPPLVCPKAIAKPTDQNAMKAIAKFMRIFATIVPAFFPREKPISSSRNPGWNSSTSTAASSTKRVSRSATLAGSGVAGAASAEAEGTAESRSAPPPSRAVRRRSREFFTMRSPR